MYNNKYEVVYRIDGEEVKDIVDEFTYQWIVDNADLRKVKKL